MNSRLRLALLFLVDLTLIAGFFVFLFADNAVNRGVVRQPGPQPIPYTAGPQLGVNLYNIQFEPDPAAVRRSFELAAQLGATHARIQAPWEDIEIHARGDFNDRRNLAALGEISAWDKYDFIVSEANAAGVQLIMRLERPPLWARAAFDANPIFQEGLAEDGNSTGPPDDPADFGAFVAAVVERYDGDGNEDAPGSPTVRFFQIWNEPNLKNEWNWQTPRPEDFVELLRVAADAARAANPDAVIVFPGLAPTDGLDQRAPMTELEYLDRVYKAGGAEYFDIMAAQAYGLGQPPDENRYIFLRNRANWNWRNPIDTRNDVSRVVLLREVMERHGDTQTPVWVTEFGWNAAPDTIPPERRFTWGEPVSEETKGEYLVGQLERAQREWPWMGVMNVWMLRFGGYAEPDPADPTPYFALVSRDWQPLPAYERLQAYLNQPAVAGVGAHTWEHPAVESLPDGWRIRFYGNKIVFLGGLDAEAGPVRGILNGQPGGLDQVNYNNQRAWATPELPLAEHTIELRGNLPPDVFVVERNRPFPLFWDYGGLVILLLLVGSSVLTAQQLTPRLDALRRAWQLRATPTIRGVVVLTLMLLALLLFYRLSPQLPVTVLGLVLFAGLALWRPDLALVFVPLTVPLYFMPKGIFDTRFGLRENGIFLPLHEVVLLITVAATATRWAWSAIQGKPEHQSRSNPYPPPAPTSQSESIPHSAFRIPHSVFRIPHSVFRIPHSAFCISHFAFRILHSYAPVTLFLAAGLWGVIIADARGPALRELRWLIIEPLLFFGLVKFWAAHRNPDGSHSSAYRLLIPAFLVGGALAAVIGILQFGGLNLVPLIGQKVGFSDDSIFVEGVRRVSSLYGHPNNLGLSMGRIWPIAAVLALFAWREPGKRNRAILLGLVALLSIGGLLVSFSRGAYLGALVAGAVIAAALLPAGWWRSRRVLVALGTLSGLAALAVALILILDIERFNPFGASSGIRIQTWISALAMLRDHPLGIGLDQFGQLYPQYINPALTGTNEINTAHPHNLLLDIALRMGPLGLIAFGWLIWHMGRKLTGGRDGRAQHAPTLCLGILAALAAALTHGLVDAFYFWPDLAFAFWLFIALADDPPK